MQVNPVDSVVSNVPFAEYKLTNIFPFVYAIAKLPFGNDVQASAPLDWLLPFMSVGPLLTVPVVEVTGYVFGVPVNAAPAGMDPLGA